MDLILGQNFKNRAIGSEIQSIAVLFP